MPALGAAVIADVRNVAAVRPAPRTDRNSQIAHEQLLEKARKGGIDVYFLGDSITRRWGATDYPEFLANWNTNFFGWNAANFGWGGDRIENMLWRLENGELDGVHPRIIVVLAGISRDKLHPGLKGYQVWADGLKPIFTEILGPPARTDHAPPPTGDPNAKPLRTRHEEP